MTSISGYKNYSETNLANWFSVYAAGQQPASANAAPAEKKEPTPVEKAQQLLHELEQLDLPLDEKRNPRTGWTPDPQFWLRFPHFYSPFTFWRNFKDACSCARWAYDDAVAALKSASNETSLPIHTQHLQTAEKNLRFLAADLRSAKKMVEEFSGNYDHPWANKLDSNVKNVENIADRLPKKNGITLGWTP